MLQTPAMQHHAKYQLNSRQRNRTGFKYHYIGEMYIHYSVQGIVMIVRYNRKQYELGIFIILSPH